MSDGKEGWLFDVWEMEESVEEDTIGAVRQTALLPNETKKMMK